MRWKINYCGESWLFIKEYRVKIDNKPPIALFPTEEISRSNRDGLVWEIFGESAIVHAEIINNILLGQQTWLRMQGSEGYKDIIFSHSDIQQMRDAILIFRSFGGKWPMPEDSVLADRAAVEYRIRAELQHDFPLLMYYDEAEFVTLKGDRIKAYYLGMCNELVKLRLEDWQEISDRVDKLTDACRLRFDLVFREAYIQQEVNRLSKQKNARGNPGSVASEASDGMGP